MPKTGGNNCPVGRPGWFLLSASEQDFKRAWVNTFDFLPAHWQNNRNPLAYGLLTAANPGLAIFRSDEKYFLKTFDLEARKVTACPHLAFVYIGYVGDFEYQSGVFQGKWQDVNVGVEEFKFDNFNQYLQQAGYDNKLLAPVVT